MTVFDATAYGLQEGSELAAYLEFTIEQLRTAGSTMVSRFGGPERKGNLYINESTSLEINDQLRTAIGNQFPDHTLFSKGDADLGSRHQWICDPIDGAFMYSQKVPIAVTSLTLAVDGEPLVGGVYAPFQSHMYVAVTGHGAYKNGQRIQVNTKRVERYTTINAEWWPGAVYDVDRMLHDWAIEVECYPIHIGSVIHSACLVAEGAIAASLFGGHIVGKNHEAAAALILMQETHGRFTDLHGRSVGFTGEIPGFIVSNTACHEQLVQRISEFLELEPKPVNGDQ